MRMIAPRVPGLDEVTIAEQQGDYKTLTAAVIPGGVLTRWRPSPEELARLNAGEDLFLAVLTFGQPLQPLSLQVGAEGWRPLETPG